uniref:Uncharacterized protein n=1 Tax=Rhizophora mucronata TaxID=61149 RepID=A0A2P2Q803_RHIMU
MEKQSVIQTTIRLKRITMSSQETKSSP